MGDASPENFRSQVDTRERHERRLDMVMHLGQRNAPYWGIAILGPDVTPFGR